MKAKNKYKIILITVIIAAAVFYTGIKPKSESLPFNSYLVHLDGKKIGIIKDKEELLDKINQEQESIKNKYSVDVVHPPQGLQITEYVSYDNNYSDINDIYNMISDFSIDGYTVSIVDANNDKKTLKILNKEDFDKSMQKLMTIFIPQEKYESYVNGTQKEITDTGEYVQDIYLEEKIFIKEGHISIKDEILTSSQEISSYLLYGSSAETKKYTVKAGDTLESIAEANSLNVEELLIANPELKSEDVLLSSRGDQTINVSLINPVVNVISKAELVETQIATFETTVKYDNRLNVGHSYVEQQGENGVAKVRYNVTYKNREITEVQKVSANELTPPINKVIVRGGYRPQVNLVSEPGEWGRPTVNYCKLSSSFGYRSGSFHDAIDIACGYETPIYAVADGVVIASGFASGNPGIHVRIDHQNGYYTSYLHLANTFVKVGQRVTKGQHIGSMGATGRAFGVHLHFSVYYIPGGTGYKYDNKYALNPINVSPVFRY